MRQTRHEQLLQAEKRRFVSTPKSQWIIVIASCFTIFEGLYQNIYINRQWGIDYHGHEHCDYKSLKLKHGFGHYQFHFGQMCKHYNRTILDFFDNSTLERAPPYIIHFIDTVDRLPKKSNKFGSFGGNLYIYWLFINFCHIFTGFVLYWGTFAVNLYTKRLLYIVILPWGLITTIVFFGDIVFSGFFIYFYFKCHTPSICISTINGVKDISTLVPFDKPSKNGAHLTKLLTNMPKRFLIISLKHVFIIPALIAIFLIILYRYRKYKLLDEVLKVLREAERENKNVADTEDDLLPDY